MSGLGRTIHGLLFAVFLIGFYLHADLVLSATLKVPAIGALVGGSGLLAMHFGGTRNGDWAFAVAWIALAFATLLLNPALWGDGAGAGHWSGYATSFAVFLASLVMALGVITGARQMAADTVARVALMALTLLVLGVLAERFLGLDVVSEAVRAMLYREDLIYAENVRDRLIYGSVRAKLFTSEPSHVAKFFVLMLLVWYTTASGRARVPMLYVWLCCGVLLIQSPSVLIALPAAWVADLCRSRGSTGWLIAAIGAVVLAPLAIAAAETVFAGRIAHIASGQDTSFLIRIVLPFEVMARVWSDYPLFGLGFGAKESGIPYAIAAAQSLGLDAGLLLTTTSPLGNNGLAIAMIQLGLVGSVAFAASLVLFWRFACGRYGLFAAAAMFAYLLLIGGINDPRFWGGLALITAAAALAEKRRRQVQAGGPRSTLGV